MRKQFGGAAALAAIIGIAGCGSSTKTVVGSASQTASAATAAASSAATSTTTSAMTKAQAAKTYLADVAPANKVLDTFKNSSADTQSGFASAAKPVITADNQVDAKLLVLAHEYPPAANDLHAEASADAQLIGDLESVGTTHDLTQWEQTAAKDSAASGVAVNTVRLDLGLPQVTDKSTS